VANGRLSRLYWWQFATGGKFVDYVTAIKINLGKDMSTNPHFNDTSGLSSEGFVDIYGAP
jgi:hypothetical protein